AGAEQLHVVADAEAHRAAQHHAELLVHVVMLRHVCTGIELDDRERRLLARDLARVHSVPDAERRDSAELAETHYWSGVRSAASFAFSSAGIGSETATRTKCRSLSSKW